MYNVSRDVRQRDVGNMSHWAQVEVCAGQSHVPAGMRLGTRSHREAGLKGPSMDHLVHPLPPEAVSSLSLSNLLAQLNIRRCSTHLL